MRRLGGGKKKKREDGEKKARKLKNSAAFLRCGRSPKKGAFVFVLFNYVKNSPDRQTCLSVCVANISLEPLLEREARRRREKSWPKSSIPPSSFLLWPWWGIAASPPSSDTELFMPIPPFPPG